MAGNPQIVYCGSTNFIRILKTFKAQFSREFGHLFSQICQRVNELSHFFVHALLGNQRPNDLAKFFQCGAVIAQHLTAQQIQRLNGVGAFIGHVDAVVAHKLLHAPFFDVAMSAKYLHAGVGCRVTVVGDKRFDNRRQQGNDFTRILANFFIRMVKLFVEQQRAVNSQSTAAFCIGFGGQKHLADIRVHDDGVSGFVFGFNA